MELTKRKKEFLALLIFSVLLLLSVLIRFGRELHEYHQINTPLETFQTR